MRRLRAGALIAWAAACLLAAGARAEGYAPRPLLELLPPGVSYDPAVPTPRDVTGYDVGEIVTPYELLIAYARAVDAASDRVSIEEIGRSHLRRPILAVTVTSEANQARLPEIRARRHEALEPDAPPAPDDQPAVIEVVHAVHGDETSAFDVAPLLLYHLAAAEDDATRALREHAVVTMIVTLNPDGAARASAWYNAHHAHTPVSHPAHRDAQPDFLAGRGNHYWFDLNRQWLPVTQPEAVAVVGWTQDWLPNVVADVHEMGGDSTYFIGPGPRAGLNPLLTDESFELGRAIAAAVAAEADAEGRLYVSEESFDDFYLGYATSYPGLLGSVPLLFEQSASDGVIYDGVDGPQRYDDKIDEHFNSLLAAIDAAAGMRRELAAYQRRYFAGVLSQAAADPVKGYVFASSDRGRLRAFLDLLDAHRLDVRRLEADVEVDGRVFRGGDAFVVTLDQPRAGIARGLFETRIPEGMDEFYDVSGWTMPLAFGLDVAALDARARARARLGGPEGPDAVPAALPPAEASYAYVMEWGERRAPRAVRRALAAGLRARVLPAPAQVRTADGEVAAHPGAVVVPVAGQPLDPEAIHALMTRAATEDDVTVHAAVSGATTAGPDLGGFDLAPLEAPRVLLVTGRGVDMEEAGEVWRLLDLEMETPVVMVDQPDLTAGLLYDFTHVIMVDGDYSSLPRDLASGVAGWVRDGGVFIGIHGGAEWASDAGVASAERLSRAESRATAAVKGPQGALPAPPARRPRYADLRRLRTESEITGAVFAVNVDATNPIAFGYEAETSHVHREGVDAFAADPRRPYEAVAWYADAPLVSGYASEANLARLAGATAVFAERRGEGAVVLFADDPLFRGYWLASERMFMNAIFFARAISPDGLSSYE